MRIGGLHVDGYGVWSGLKLEGLCDGLNVLYGPNEAGKTTLLQFIREVLYGFSTGRRRYLPPIHGGRPGGSVELAGADGRFQLERYCDAGRHAEEQMLALTAADGSRQGEHLLKVLLANVDETTFRNVFAVGLREMQELGTLGDSEAADLLYNLTAGLDRVSLVEVIRELETSRSRILDRHGGPCRIAELLAQREKLRREIEELGELTRRYARLSAEREQLSREIARLEQENTAAEHRARVIELAITLRERWARRAALDGELAALGPPQTMPDGAVEQLDALNTRLEKHRRRLEQLQQRRGQLRSEASGLGVNEALCRQAARIEALAEQQSWIDDLQEQMGELEAEIAEIESALTAEHRALGFDDRLEPGMLTALSSGTVAALRPAAKVLRKRRQTLAEAARAATSASETVRSLSHQIEESLSGRNADDLTRATEDAGKRVAQLRRRMQIDDRVDEMTRYQTELEEQTRRLVDRQLLPVWILFGLGGVFVLGVVLVMAGLFMPTSITGSLGWALAILGLGGCGGAAGLKILLERSNARQLDACQKQIRMLQRQIEAANDERELLDAQLSGPAPLEARLDAAEKELAALEELVPLEGRRVAAQQDADRVQRLAADAKAELDAARVDWRRALRSANLPDKLAPKQVRNLLRRSDKMAEMQRRRDGRREELERRRREFDSMCSRIRQLAAETGIAESTENPAEQLRRLGEALAVQHSALARRGELRRHARGLRRKRAKHEEALSRLKHRRRNLLREADCADQRELRERAVRAARAEVLRRDRDAVAGEIAAAAAGICTEDALGEQLKTDSSNSLEARRDDLLERLAALEKELQNRFEQRGQLAEQLQVLAEDKQLAGKTLELASLDKRLEDAAGRWRVLALTGRVLEEIKVVYENERQPETLQEASGYLDRLTEGRYRRVWTPLGEDVLRVDDADGNSLAVEMLSRGTREQLFLALRLALVASYARRGATLPLVLDDVLVNFDATRARAAAAVLRDFARQGHQLLVFTCHEHILKLFKSLKMPVSQLPDNSQADLPPVTFEQTANKKNKRSKKADQPPAVVQEPEDEQEEDPIDAEDSGEDDLFEPAEEDAPWEDELDEGRYDEDDEDEEYEEDEYEDDDTAEAA